MIAFHRYASFTDSTWTQPSSKYTAWLEFTKSTYAYSNTTRFKTVSVYYGNSKSKVKITVKSGDQILATDSLNSGDDFYVYTYTSSSYLDNVRLEFEGYDSPDVYAVSFEDEAGIYVDNIALRGCSGTAFTTTDGALLAKSYSYMGVDLFILQFGGNSVPGLPDKKSAENFANAFYYQIALLKRIMPDACFIVIGPSDMSVKEKDYMITYPNLENIIDALRNATHKAGGVYWDMYTAMGGKNSMLSWVSANPQMAGPDYTHFTPYGATIIANMFYNALILEYADYSERTKK
jgi:lysophospholipase L1-like esterase